MTPSPQKQQRRNESLHTNPSRRRFLKAGIAGGVLILSDAPDNPPPVCAIPAQADDPAQRIAQILEQYGGEFGTEQGKNRKEG